jgi:hypothetical protein
LPTPPLPVPPPPIPPPPAPQSATSQPNPTKNAAPQSDALENTLEKLRALQRQAQPPRNRANPAAGGAPNGGGNPNATDTSALSAKVAGEDVVRMNDPVFRAFAERAIRAVLDPRCADLPLPKSMQGQRRTLDFRFSP